MAMKWCKWFNCDFDVQKLKLRTLIFWTIKVNGFWSRLGWWWLRCGRCGGVVSPDEGHAPPRPLLTTDVGKGLAGFRPHAAPLAHACTVCPSLARRLQVAGGECLTGLDHLSFYPEGTWGSGGGQNHTCSGHSLPYYGIQECLLKRTQPKRTQAGYFRRTRFAWGDLLRLRPHL